MSQKKAAKPAMLSVKEIAKTAVKIETPAAVTPAAAPSAKAEPKAAKAAKPAAKAAKAPAKKPAAKKAAAPAKKAAPKAAAPASMQAELFVQYQGFEVSEQDLLALVRADYPGEISALRLYVKPEEHAAYYVVNENETGVVYF